MAAAKFSSSNNIDGNGGMWTKVGPFVLSSFLGEGTFSKVRLGRHEQTGREYAVKVIEKSAIKAHGVKDNVRREIEIMHSLNHYNIVNLHQVMTTNNRLYLVLDLVRGGDLFNMIERRQVRSIDEARRYFQQLVNGVHYCHSHGIYHRDLKPENLLLSENGVLKITDFGISSIRQGTTDLHFTTCGTPFYCAPEIFNTSQKGYSGAKIDAWSCGIILYLLVTGSLPFHSHDFVKLANQISRFEPYYPPTLQPELVHLIQMLLQKDARNRYTTAEVKRHPWFLVDYQKNIRHIFQLEKEKRENMTRQVSDNSKPQLYR